MICFTFLLFQIIKNTLQISTDKIVVLSDIHLNIDYQYSSPTDLGKLNIDSNEYLFRSTLTKLKSVVDSPKIILIGGDLVTHQDGIHKIKYLETQKVVLQIINEFFPSSVVIPTIGNNDFSEHYDSPVGKEKIRKYNDYKEIFFGENFTLKNSLNKDFNTTFLKGCYYSIKINDTTLISINSNYYSFKHKSKDPEFNSTDMLDFIENTLSELQSHEQAIIMYHIPIYGIFHANNSKFEWKSEFSDRYVKITRKYRKKIISTFSFHTHWGGLGAKNFKLKSSFFNTFFGANSILSHYFQDCSVNDMFFPSVSPVFGNFPGFSVVTFENFQKIKNIENYYLNVELSDNDTILSTSQWNNYYNFREDFGFSKFDCLDTYDFITRRFGDKEETKKKFVSMFGGFDYKKFDETLKFIRIHGQADFTDKYRKFLCDFICFNDEQVIECMKEIFVGSN